MSLLVANVTQEGLIFAADRNLSDSSGNKVDEAPKVLKSADGEVIAGYVGNAQVGSVPMQDWLADFLARHGGASLPDVSHALAGELEASYANASTNDRGTIVHVGGFETGKDGNALPVIWYIRDAEIQLDGTVKHLAGFEHRDELKEVGTGEPPYFADATGDEIRQMLREANTPLPWAGFRQGFDLGTFSRLDRLIWKFSGALLAGVSDAKIHEAPTTIEEWAPFMRMSVLAYASYFEAFYPAGKRPVGGGVDVETIAWPS